MRILVTNLHSALNLGDDAIFDVTLRELKKNFPGATISIAANDPSSWEKYGSEIEVIPSLVTWVKKWVNGEWILNKPLVFVYLFLLILAVVGWKFKQRIKFGSKLQRRLLSVYYESDLVICCGGGNIYSTKLISWGLFWELLMIYFPGSIGKPVYLLPQSIGPIHGKLQKWLLAKTLNKTRHTFARDSISFELLRSLNLTSKYRLMPDLAFNLPVTYIQKDRHGLNVGFSALSLNKSMCSVIDQKTYEDTLEEIILYLDGRYDVTFHLIVQCYGPTKDHDDRVVTRRLYERLQGKIKGLELVDNLRDGLSARNKIAEMDVMVGSRMHSGVFSLGSAVPTILLGYLPKYYGLMKLFNMEKYCVSMEDLKNKKILVIIDEVIENRQKIKAQIESGRSQIKNELANWLGELLDE